MKFSQLPVISSILETASVAVLQAGKVYRITKQNLFSNYYTKSQVDTLISNVTAGGVPWQLQTFDNLSIAESSTRVITHNADNIDFMYDVLIWSDSEGKYLRMQTPLAETGRTKDSLTLFSGLAISKFQVTVFG